VYERLKSGSLFLAENKRKKINKKDALRNINSLQSVNLDGGTPGTRFHKIQGIGCRLIR
jgi:hypothetical protein